MFRHLGQQDLGWLLIDEAGQATAASGGGCDLARAADGGCGPPMFEIVNEIAYGGQMLNCTRDRGVMRLGDSHWIDVPRASSSGNWVAAEGNALEELLAGLRYEMVDFSEVFVISPFRAVARNLVKYRKRYPGLTAGTIHTAQGREADVVILVLGVHARRPGARALGGREAELAQCGGQSCAQAWRGAVRYWRSVHESLWKGKQDKDDRARCEGRDLTVHRRIAFGIEFLDSEPLLTRVWFVEAMAAGAWALQRRERNSALLKGGDHRALVGGGRRTTGACSRRGSDGVRFRARPDPSAQQ